MYLETDKSVRVHIRWCIRRDMPEVLDIENKSFEYPWTEENFLEVLRKRNCIGMVAELREKVIGYMVYELHKNKLHILNLAVHPAYRRKYIGFQLIEKLKSKLSSHHRTQLELLVRENNLPAHLFFKKQGFLACEVIRRYYEENNEDAYKFYYALPILVPSSSSLRSDFGPATV